MTFRWINRSEAIIACIVCASIIFGSTTAWFGFRAGVRATESRFGIAGEKEVVVDADAVLPPDGYVIPVRWGDIGSRLVDSGVIDRRKLDKLYEARGGLSAYTRALLEPGYSGELTIDEASAGELLNILWALGLGNRNAILDEGPMQDERYGGPGGFASTGGWSLATGTSMEHYSHHAFVSLTPDQQELVERVSQNIYRPCCGNSTYFPDCNHGMAMLGLLELMASQGASEAQLYETALHVNAYWFPDTYLTIAKYFVMNGIAWADVDAREVLGYDYSSGTGYREILSQVEPATGRSGGSCGV